MSLLPYIHTLFANVNVVSHFPIFMPLDMVHWLVAITFRIFM